MTGLERYLGLHFLKGYFLVLLVLLALFGFLDLVDELSEVGQGSYRLADALLYVSATFPTKVLEFSAVCTLMGGSLALSGLVRGSELLAMRAAGMSLMQIALALLKVVLMLTVALAIVAEWIAPMSQQWGFLHRHQALSGTEDLRTEQGFWSRDQHTFLNVGAILHGRLPQDVNLYRFDAKGRLEQYVHADQAILHRDGKWLLEGVTLKSWQGGLLKTEHSDRWIWQSFLTSNQLKALELPPKTLSVSDLWQYVRYLKATSQQSEQYELLLWQRSLFPLSMGVMLFFLLPVVVTPPRSGGFGWQVVLAIMVGVLYFLSTQVIANLGLLLDISPLMTALMPTLAVFLLALVLLGRSQY